MPKILPLTFNMYIVDMKAPLLCLTLFICSLANTLQAQTTTTYTGTDAASFDFWLGKWLATWDGGKHGTNDINREMGGKIIQENFSDLGTGYFGKSWTVYQPTEKVWHQTWVDNNGLYLTLTGGVAGNNRVLECRQKSKTGEWENYKMTFSNIQANSFEWEWEKSTDDGKTWQSLWKIKYDRQL